MSFLRTFKHLLPSGAAWRLTIKKTLRRFFEGLAAGAPELARAFIDGVYDDLFPRTTRELAKWETQFGLPGGTDEQARRDAVDASWKARGGQSPKYLQDIVQAAGFDLYIHEWWSSGPPYVARDPRLYTRQPLIGSVQCGEPLAQCGERTAQCNAFLANDPGYIVNLDFTRRPPPRVPDDPDTWPYFLYWGGATFPDPAYVPANRRAELERLLLKLCPTQQWLVLLVVYFGDARETLQDDLRVTLQGDTRVTLGAA